VGFKLFGCELPKNGEQSKHVTADEVKYIYIYTISVQWAQEDVETSYNLLNNIYISVYNMCIC